VAVRDNLDGGVCAVGDVQVGGDWYAWKAEVSWAHFVNGREELIVERAAYFVADGQGYLDQIFRVAEVQYDGNGGQRDQCSVLTL